MSYWLMKSEPDVFGIDDLAASPKQTTCWDGVRNYQARNMMRDDMAVGDEVFYYHSNCDQPGIVGVATVVRTGYPDDTAFDKNDKHFDPKSDPENPRWFMVDIKLARKLPRKVTLAELREHTDGALAELPLLRRGNRLSVMPVGKKEWRYILSLAKKSPKK